MFPYKVTETTENISLKTLLHQSDEKGGGGLIERGGLLQNLTSKGGLIR